MGKLVKLLIGITLLFIIASTVIIAGALLYFDPNQHKDFIAAKVERATGRSLAIAGNIKMTYYPWLGIEADGITVGNAPGFGDAPFLHVDHIALRIKTLPLLKQHYELDTFRLHGFQVNLARNDKGVSNWEDFSGQPEEESTSRDRLQFAAVILGGVDIKDGVVTWKDDASQQQVNVKNIHITTGELTFGAPINLNIGLHADSINPDLKTDLTLSGLLNYDLQTEVYAFRPIDLLAKIQGDSVAGGKTDLKFHGAVEANLKSDTLVVNDLTLDLLDTHVSGKLFAEHIKSGKPKTVADIKVQGEDLAKVVQLLDPETGKDLGRLNDRSIDLTLHAEHDLKESTAKLSNLDIKLFGSAIKGEVDATNLDDKPSAKGYLKANGPDLPALIQVIGQFESGNQRKLSQIGKNLASVNNKAFDLAMQFNANTAAGDIEVPEFSANALGITTSGNFKGSSMISSSPEVNGKFKLHGENLQPLLAALGKKDLGNVLQTIDIDTAVKNEGNEITLSPLQVKSVFAGKDIPDSPATVSIQADTRLNPEKQTLNLKNMQINGPGMNVTGNLSASKIKSDKPAVQGNLEAQGQDLALLFRLAGMDSLASQLAGVKDKSFNVKTGLNADMGAGSFSVSSLDAKLLGAVITGQVSASNIQSGKPTVKGKLSATGPDLPALLTVLGQFETGPKPSMAQYGKRLAKVKNPNFDFTTEFDVDPAKGNYHIPAFNATSLGISVKGNLNAEQLSGNNGKIDGKFTLLGENLSDVLSALGQNGMGEVLKKLAVDAGIQGQGGDIKLNPLQIKATFAGKEIPNSPVDMLFSANAGANLDKQTLKVADLKLNGMGLNLSGNIDATGIREKPSFNGNLKLAEFNLREFTKQLNQKLPVTADKEVFKKVGFNSAFSGSENSIKFEKMSVALDDSTISGDLSVKQFSQPAINFGININAINLDRYLPPSPKNKKATPETAAAAAATELPMDTLRALNVNGELNAGTLIVSNTKLENVKLVIKAKDGDIRLQPLTADLYGGKYEGDIALDARAKKAKLNANTKLTKVQMEPLLIDYLQEPQSPLVGVANLVFKDLAATGSSDQELKRSLSGVGKLNLSKGILRGVDVNKTLRQVEIMIEDKRFGKIDSSGETPFDKLTATLNINKGVVGNKDMLMEAPGFQVTGNGVLANLKNESISYHMLVSVVESRTTEGTNNYNLGGYDLPIHCSGKLSSPDCSPDIGEIAKVMLQKSAGEKLKEILSVPSEQPATQPGDSATTTTTQPAKKKSKEDVLQDAGKKLLEGIFE